MTLIRKKAIKMSQSREKIQAVAFEIIGHAGEARSLAMEAIQCAKDGKTSLARDNIERSSLAFTRAHQAQSSLLQEEARGEMMDPTLIMIHAQDHLMTSQVMKDMAEVVIDLYQRLES